MGGQACGRPTRYEGLYSRHATNISRPATALQAALHDFSRTTKRCVRSAQLFLVDKGPPSSLLLGTHSAAGVFPGRMTGICAELDGDVTVEAVLVAAAAKHGVSLLPEKLERRAIFEFLEVDDPDTVNEEIVCYAQVDSLQGEKTLNSTDAFDPCWVPLDAIPYLRMPVDDAVWYPPFIAGRRLAGR